MRNHGQNVTIPEPVPIAACRRQSANRARGTLLAVRRAGKHLTFESATAGVSFIPTRLHSVDLRQSRGAKESQLRRSPNRSLEKGRAMLRWILAASAVLLLVAVCVFPDDAYARRGGGGGFRGGGGGFHGGGMRGGGVHVGGGRVHGGGYRVAGRPRPSHPIAGRPGYPGRPIAGRPGRPVAGYPGYGRGYYRPGWGYGAAAVGAATAAGAYYGSYGYYGNRGCYYDQYGQMVCPQSQYQY